MKAKFLFGIVTTLLVLALSGCFILQEPEEASAPLVAPTVAAVADEPEPAEEPAEEMAEDVSETAVVVEEEEYSDEYDDEVEEEAEMAEESAEESAEEAMEESDTAGSAFVIDDSQSTARFLIDEVLRGEPVTVVGETDQVAGQIVFDVANPAATQVGAILVNARGITTDNNFRNNAIKNRILNTDTYEFITFEPTALNGLPDSTAVGETYSFEIVGDLTIRDQTLEVTFAAEVTVDSESQISGLASTNFLYADFGLEIPFSQAVDSVEDDVTLELEFVAVNGN